MGSARWTKLSWLILGLVLIAALAAPEIAAADRTVTATLDEPFEINGEVFRSGELTVRKLSSYNPATTLNEVWVGRRCLGVMLADASGKPQPGTTDRLVFERNDAGRLVLVGFAYRNETACQFYNYRTTASRAGWTAPSARVASEVIASN